MKDKFTAGEELIIKFKVGKTTESGVFIYPANSDPSAGQWYYQDEIKKSIMENRDA